MVMKGGERDEKRIVQWQRDFAKLQQRDWRGTARLVKWIEEVG
jgi:hypothetical protein